ncbi:molybdenum cofactor biosynthesis protein MoaE [Allohahella marinimesophila]|uniref:Molybdopterin synthase catalytic subunit n=1 Tax=Allohahella marinimesophila TaxID=1054972 RepID=A0ABP7PPS4_9GAMM
MHIRVELGPAPIDNLTLARSFRAGLNQGSSSLGAICSFEGLVREYGDDRNVIALELEHYPGMTERSLREIAEHAAERWQLLAIAIVHRVGRIELGEVVVVVSVASSHRHAAFEACAYIMDRLKTEAPFWKKEISASGQSWVASKDSDGLAAARWAAKD